MANVELGTNYDIHKELMSRAPGCSEEHLNEQLVTIGLWFSSKPKTKYFTLMCRERYDFTVFNFTSPNYDKAVQELREVLESRGELIAIDYAHGFDCYECWVKIDDEAAMYLLFDYSQGVIEI